MTWFITFIVLAIIWFFVRFLLDYNKLKDDIVSQERNENNLQAVD